MAIFNLSTKGQDSLEINYSEIRYRIEASKFGVTTPRLFGLGSSLRPHITVIIITNQGLSNFQRRDVMKHADKYLAKFKNHCEDEYGWRNIYVNYAFRTHQADATQPREELYWDIPPQKK